MLPTCPIVWSWSVVIFRIALLALHRWACWGTTGFVQRGGCRRCYPCPHATTCHCVRWEMDFDEFRVLFQLERTGRKRVMQASKINHGLLAICGRKRLDLFHTIKTRCRFNHSTTEAPIVRYFVPTCCILYDTHRTIGSKCWDLPTLDLVEIYGKCRQIYVNIPYMDGMG